MKTTRSKEMFTVAIELNTTELSAAEAWRESSCIGTRAEALRELVRLGLLSEIRKVYENSERCREASDLERADRT